MFVQNFFKIMQIIDLKSTKTKKKTKMIGAKDKKVLLEIFFCK